MGVIEKLRNKAGLVVGIIGVSMAAFVLTDLFRNAYVLQADTHAGEVLGKKIEYDELNLKFQEAIQQTRMNNPDANLDENQKNAILDQTWESLISDAINTQQYSAHGLEVPGEEVYDLFVGPKPSPIIMQVFSQGGRSYNAEEVRKILQKSQTDEQLQAQVKPLEDYIIKNRLNEKFNGLIRGGMFASKNEAMAKYLEDNRKASINFLAINYGTIPDSTVKLTDADYSAYYNAHKEEFRQNNEEVILKYVMFPKVPSGADSAATLTEISKIATELRETKDDSLFSAAKSEQRSEWIFKSFPDLDFGVQDKIAGVPEDSVVGPYLEGNFYKVVK